MMKIVLKYAFMLHFSVSIILIFHGCQNNSTEEAADSKKLEAALDSLDGVISEKGKYAEFHQKEIESLKKGISSMNDPEQATLYRMLFDHYRRVQTDSALHYLNLIEQHTEPDNYQENARLLISRADIYGVTGMYGSALELLGRIQSEKLDIDPKTAYYHTCRTVYGWLSDYSSLSPASDLYKQKTAQYRDSILEYSSPGISRNVVLADKLLIEGKTEEALELSFQDLPYATDENRRYIFSNIAEAYRQQGDSIGHAYYLALTAIDDIRSGVKEYRALPTLARQLFDEGDIDRAYSYLTCSMEDANACKARLRSVETSSIFPIIDKVYKEQENAQRRSGRVLTTVLVCASLLFGGFLLLLRRQNSKLTQARQRLLESNTHLNKTNVALAKADKVKEEYIAFYLDKCRGYLEALKRYRQDLLKLAKSKQNDTLLKRLNSSETLDQEQQRFYKDFDEAFLNIHPHFIEKFNALLEDGCQLSLKRGELMNTELRIFALIRLGVTDTASIANFLDYSLATVYNYRSRLRNQSKVSKEEFEEQVRNL